MRKYSHQVKICLKTARQLRREKNVDSKSLQKNLPESIRRAQRNVDRSHGDIHRHQARPAGARVLLLALATQIPK